MSKLEKVPLCVDLDGTLIEEETHRVLTKSLLSFPYHVSLRALSLYFLQGRAPFKVFCAQQVLSREEALWTVRKKLVSWLHQQKKHGHRLILATGAPLCVAHPIARQLNLFDDVFASTVNTNLVGSHKARHLERLFGKGGFDYIGNSWQDRAVWHTCRYAYLVTNSFLLRAWGRQFLPYCFFWQDVGEFQAS